MILRILDANLDRAREGLRVIEEWCRFGLEDGTLSEQCKRLRQEIAQWHTDRIKAYRDTPHDPGTALTTPLEQVRRDVHQLLRVNFGRVQEALRVLEEYGKLDDLAFAEAMKHYRYRTYVLEQQLFPPSRLERLRQSRLYLVTSPSPDLLPIVEAALKGGLTLVQLREKEAQAADILRIGRPLRALCDRYNALFILNDRPDLALALGADGVHVGQEDAPIALARRILGPDKLVGQSTHAPDQAERAVAQGADYIGVGPIYATPTKQDRRAVGLDYARFCAEHIPLPGFAIGGIDSERLPEVLGTGIKQVAVVRAIMQASDPQAATQDLLQVIPKLLC